MNRNSIEKISTKLQKSKLNRSNYNPQSTTSITIPSNFVTKYKKNQQSTISIKNINLDTNSIENRYEALQKLYQGLMAKINMQNKNVKEQSQQINKLHSIHEENQKQISRLRGLLGFLEKIDISVQTDNQMYQQITNKNKQSINIKSCTTIYNYTTKQNIKMTNNSNIFNIQSPIRITSPKNTYKNYKSLHKSTNILSKSSKYYFHEQNSQLFQNWGKQNQVRCRSPGPLKQKYKFVPSLILP